MSNKRHTKDATQVPGRLVATGRMGAMPSCSACGHYLTPTSMKPDGSCPFCFQTVDYKRAGKAEQLRAQGQEPEEIVSPPWHFKVLVGGTAVYLGYRFLQGVEWLAHKL